MWLRSRHWLSVAALLVGVGVIMTPAGASPTDDEPAQDVTDVERVMTADEVFEEDARAYADLHGVSIEEARDRFTDETAFAAEVAEISDDHPDEFVVSRIVHSDDIVGTVLLTEYVGEDLAARFAARQLSVDIRTDAPVSEAALLARLDNVQRALVTAGYPEVVGVPDLENGTLHFEIEVPTSQRGQASSQLWAALPPQARATDVSVRFVEGSLGELEAVYGGALTPHSTTNSKCTAAFTVKKSGVSGFLTAGHCGDNRDVWDHSAGVRVNAPFKSQHRGGWGDFQWHTSSRSEGPRFYSNWSSLRDHTARRTPSLGQTLCVFGRTSGRKCHEVYKLGVSNTTGGKTYKQLAAMHRHVTAGGDSGGPWYASTNGYGVHHGWKWIWGIKRSLFAQARYMDEALGVLPKTTN